MSLHSDGIPNLRICSSDFPERARVAMFREVFGRTILNIDMEPLADEPLVVDMTMYALDGLGLAAGRLSPMRNRHVAGAADNDDLVLVVLEAGHGVIEQGGRRATVRAGEAVLTANGEPGIFTGEAETRLVNIRLKRARLSAVARDPGSTLGRPIQRGSPALRLLAAYSRVICDSDAMATAALRNGVVGHIYDLTAMALGATPEVQEIAMRGGVRAARLQAIKVDVREHAAAHNLSIAEVARRHSVTPRYVQMLLEQDGTTFSEVLLAERLSRAHRMLVDDRYLHLRVSQIAYNAGFSDLSYFNRTFRARFGDTPRRVRAGRR